ncbi:hypothetical protein ACU4GD_38900 [Cupriavidus basilensis]
MTAMARDAGIAVATGAAAAAALHGFKGDDFTDHGLQHDARLGRWRGGGRFRQ